MRYIIVDRDATCWMENAEPKRIEIREIGALALAAETGPMGSEFSALVRPINEPTLSAIYMGLTGIPQESIDTAGE